MMMALAILIFILTQEGAFHFKNFESKNKKKQPKMLHSSIVLVAQYGTIFLILREMKDNNC